MTHALITGGAGFIGSHLADALLARGWSVTLFDDFSPFYAREAKLDNIDAARSGGARLIEGDITSDLDLTKAFAHGVVDTVFHFAALAGVRPSIDHPDAYARVNVVGTQRVLDACVRHGVRKLIVAGSSSVYGNNEKVPFAEDDDVSRPISPYAATKVATELLCRTATHLHGLPITILRFFTVHGPRQRPDLAIRLFMSRISRGEPIRMFGNGSTSRDYTFVDDIIDGVFRAADQTSGDHGGQFRVYNLGGDQPVMLSELIKMIERVVGRSATIEPAPEQAGDVRRTWADLTRSRSELGYEPKTKLIEGLARQWSWLNEDTSRLDLRPGRPVGDAHG